MSGIAPIETNYAGYRFRSRLEARWAVALTARGIRWEYEKQGFHCTERLTLGDETINYLPDFWLPEHNLFAEVKGELPDEASLIRLANVAASLSSGGGGGCHDQGGHDVVLLGPIPEIPVRAPWVLHMHKGSLQMSPWDGIAVSGCVQAYTTLASDYGGDSWGAISDSEFYGPNVTKWRVASGILLNGGALPHAPEMWADAYRAARHARFEYGERG